MNFISLFLDDFFFGPNETDYGNRPCLNSEQAKILKYFLAELYEHAATKDIDFWSANLHIMHFEQKSLEPIFRYFCGGFDLFLKLVVNGFDFYNESDRSTKQPRYRDQTKYKLRSFEVLLESLKEYEPESANKIIALITADFTSFSLFLENLKYVLAINPVYNPEL
jgi:hypothetical protein